MERPEQHLHRACVDLLHVYAARGSLAFCHVPNGEWRRKATAARLKAMGVTAGVPDLLVWLRGGGNFQVELKAGSRRPSPVQVDWAARMADLGVRVYLARSVDDLEAVLRAEGVPAIGQLAPRIAAAGPGGVLDASEGVAGRVFGPRPRSSHSTRLP